MPIYDNTYRHLERPLDPPALRWLVIARLGIVERLRRRWFDGLMIFASLPFLYFLARLFAEMKLPDILGGLGEQVDLTQGWFMERIAITPATFAWFLELQLGFAFLVTIFSGSGTVSGDLRTRALPLYLSKPISRGDYVLGKLLVPAFFVALVTLVPAEILLALKILTSDGFSFFTQNPLLPLRVALASGVITAVMSVVMVALSSLSRSAWQPGLGFAILYIFSRAFAVIISFIFKSDTALLLSFKGNLARVVDALFGNAPASGPSWLLSLLVLLAWTALAGFVLNARVRAVEVVAS